MARSETKDEYGRALEIHLGAADGLQRAVVRNDVVVETARLATRRRDASRLAAKYEDKAVRARAADAVRAGEARVAAAGQAADRTFVERVDAPADRAVVYGIVRADKPSSLEVVALCERDQVLATACPDARGAWRLDVPVEGGGQKLAVVGAGAAGVSIRIAVRAGKKELFRDKELFVVRPGRVQYRELAV